MAIGSPRRASTYGWQHRHDLIKEGDWIEVPSFDADGDVVNITLNEVVFRQNVQDPTALKPFREVVKALNP